MDPHQPMRLARPQLYRSKVVPLGSVVAKVSCNSERIARVILELVTWHLNSSSQAKLLLDVPLLHLLR